MPSKATCLAVLAPNQGSTDHGGRTDASTECHHNHIVHALCYTGVALSQKRKPRVVFEQEPQIELAPSPGCQVDLGRVRVLMIRRNDPAGETIDQAAESESNAGEAAGVLVNKSSQFPGKQGKKIREAAAAVGPDLKDFEDFSIVDGAASDVRTSDVHR
jgi:hypothetical protein